MLVLLFGLLLAQPRTLTVRVIDNASQQPLPNAEIIDRVTGVRRFTNAAGQASMPRGTNESALRVRQIGFQFIDRAVPALVDTVTFALQLERRTGDVTSAGDVKPTRAQRETEQSDRWGERYVPDRIVERFPLGFSVPILFLTALADSVFWERHCFVARGVESLADARVVRLAFAPKPTVTGPDWEGAALVDSVSSILRRIEFRLTGLKPDDRPRRLEGYTTFMSPAPYFVVPDTTRAIWWRRDVAAQGLWGMPDAIQHINVRSVTFLKAIPTGYRPPP